MMISTVRRNILSAGRYDVLRRAAARECSLCGYKQCRFMAEIELASSSGNRKQRIHRVVLCSFSLGGSEPDYRSVLRCAYVCICRLCLTVEFPQKTDRTRAEGEEIRRVTPTSDVDYNLKSLAVVPANDTPT